jgi:hypothetical protein
MPVYNPTVTNYPNGVVTVISTDNTRYESILNSMGSFIYGVGEVYLKANDNSQILQSYLFNKYNVNGNIESFVQIPAIDPYQFQSSLFVKLSRNDVILDGRTNLDFTILPNESIYMILYTKQIANRDLVSLTNFFNNDFFNLFDDYREEI